MAVLPDTSTPYAGLWVGDCFIYNNSAWRLNYCVGGEVTTMYHLDRPMYLLGYLASQSKVYLIDKVRQLFCELCGCPSSSTCCLSLRYDTTTPVSWRASIARCPTPSLRLRWSSCHAVLGGTDSSFWDSFHSLHAALQSCSLSSLRHQGCPAAGVWCGVLCAGAESD